MAIQDDIDHYFERNAEVIALAEQRERRQAALREDARLHQVRIRNAEDRAQWLKANPGKTIGDYVRAKYPRHRPDKGAV
jgi:hypothetical protein